MTLGQITRSTIVITGSMFDVKIVPGLLFLLQLHLLGVAIVVTKKKIPLVLISSQLL